MFHLNKPALAPRKTPKPKLPFGVRLATFAALALGWWIAHTIGASYSASVIAGVIAGLVVLGAYELARARSRASAAGQGTPATPATVPELHEQARVAGGGAYLAHSAQGRWISAPAEVAGLVLAGPRAGKTSCVGIPALIAHPGAAVSTSTKPEVLTATLHARQALGRVWFLELTGNAQLPAGVQRLRWSPLQRARDWPGAQTVAEAMTGAAEIEHDAAALDRARLGSAGRVLSRRGASGT